MIGGRESQEGNGYETTKIRYGARATQGHGGSIVEFWGLLP